jgi:hypothetical protein
MRERDYKYHLEMMLKELNELKFDKGTRDNLFIDNDEKQILIKLIEEKLNA